MPALLCYCNCPDVAVARRIADALVQERLAACVNLLPGVQSVYRWEGRVERAEEVQLLIKTTSMRFDALSARILSLHPDDVPEIIAVRISNGLPAYLDWMQVQVDGHDDKQDARPPAPTVNTQEP